MQRTIRLKLNTTPDQKAALLEALNGFTTAFNFVAEYGWANSEKNGVKLHHATYHDVKVMVKGLPAQLVCASRVKATEALRSVFAIQKIYPAKLKRFEAKKVKFEQKHNRPYPKTAPRPPGCPSSKLCAIRYDERSYWLDWKSLTTSLATMQGRQLVRFNVPAYYHKYQGLEVDSADLLYKKGSLWLHVVVTLSGGQGQYTDSGETIGVDLGLNHPAVTSSRKFLGSGRWKEVLKRSFRITRHLQSKGTKSAKKHLKKLSGARQRFRRDCDHVLSKRIVQSATHGTTIVIEELSEIRETTEQKGRESRRRLHSWSFAQLRSFLAYKAEAAGMRVVAIDPRHTSQSCSKCGYQSRSNRKSQALFLCKQCDYQLNADLNASYNIRSKHLASLGISLAGGPQSIGLSSPPPGEGQAVCFS